MLQIPTTFVDIIGWFNSLNIEIKVFIAIIAITIFMVLIYITFKLLEVFFLFLRVILDILVKIFRLSPKFKDKNIINHEKSETLEVIDSELLENDKEIIDNNSIASDHEEDENIRERDARKSSTKDPNNRSDYQESASENSTKMTHCPNCGKKFSQNSYSKIGDTDFVSCEECEIRYILNGEYYSENEE